MLDFDFSTAIKGKKVIGYGTGITMLGTLATYPLALDYLVDDNPALKGKQIAGLDIHPSSMLDQEDPADIFILLFASTPRSVLKMGTQLTQKGFTFFEHFVDCSFLHFKSISERLKEKLDITTDYQRFLDIRLAVLNSALPNLSTISGTWLYTELIDHLLPKTDGEVAECGVFYGGNAIATLTALPALQARPYHLFDSFDGFQSFSKYDPIARKDDFKNTDFPLVKTVFSNFPQVKIHKGFFNETLPHLPDAEYAMVYIDCDLYEPTVYCCEYFQDKLGDQGGFFLHDYWVPDTKRPDGGKANFEGIKQAIAELYPTGNAQIIEFPETTHALIFPH